MSPGASGPTGSEIVVRNCYQWIGDPRLGKFAVYIDGKRRGSVPLSSSLVTNVPSGRHTVRVRLWWFMSPGIPVDLAPGETVAFDADIPRADALARRMLKGALSPWHWLCLEKVHL